MNYNYCYRISICKQEEEKGILNVLTVNGVLTANT